MPRKDENGKRLSGHQERMMAEKVKSDIFSAERARIHSGSKAILNSIFSSLPKAPIGEPHKAVMWANDVLMTSMEAIVKDDKMALENKVKLLSDLAGKLGMIRDKASEQKKIVDYITRIQKVDGADDISNIEAPIDIKKPVQS